MTDGSEASSGSGRERDGEQTGDRAAERAGGRAGDRSGGRACPRCGAELFRRHCKYVCPNHGVVMDCADTFHLQRE